MSYARVNDDHDNGKLSQFRMQLSNEVRVQTGDPFEIFQDRTHIQWGQLWKKRIKETLDTSTFLIAILTPSFFRSSECRSELKEFMTRQKKLDREDMILPVLYIDFSTSYERNRKAKDRLAGAMSRREMADWRDLRFESFDQPNARRAFAKLAGQIREAILRGSSIAA